MLLVQVRVDRSPIHGLGVFLLHDVPEGTRVWCFTPGFDLDLDPGLLDGQPEPTREWLLHYGYIDPRLHRYILACDHTRFINHSDKPNLYLNFTLDRYGVLIALRDIPTGDEITVDYQTLDGTRPATP